MLGWAAAGGHARTFWHPHAGELVGSNNGYRDSSERMPLVTPGGYWRGLRVERGTVDGTASEKEAAAADASAQKTGTPLKPQKVRQSTTRLFASGRYRDIVVRGVRQGDVVTLIFVGVPRYYVG